MEVSLYCWPPVLLPLVLIQLLYYVQRYCCLVESKPVKQYVSSTYSDTSPIWSKWVFSGFIIRRVKFGCFLTIKTKLFYSFIFSVRHNYKSFNRNVKRSVAVEVIGSVTRIGKILPLWQLKKLVWFIESI